MIANLINGIRNSINIWVSSDPHIPGELNDFSFDSLGNAINQIQADDNFNFDIAFCLGDLLHTDYEDITSGQLVKSKLELLTKGRHHFYTLGGNHDVNLSTEPNGANWVYRQYIDPTGENTVTSGVSNANRPYPVTGTYERYYIEIGNLLVLFIGDRNDGDIPGGKIGAAAPNETHASGMVTEDTVRWWLDTILKNSDRPIIVNTHHPLKDTNYGSQYQDSWRGNITNTSQIDDENDRSTYLAYIDNVLNETIFQNHLNQNTGLVDLWMSGHTHHFFGQTFEGLSELEEKFGTNFLNVANLNKDYYFGAETDSMSKHLHINRDAILVRTYVHDSPNGLTNGFQPTLNHNLSLKERYKKVYSNPSISTPASNISDLSIDNSSADQLDLSWNNDNSGVLVVRKSGGYPTFTPSDETTYLIGDAVGDGEVAFIGTAKSFTDLELTTSTTYYYNFYSFNSGGGHIKYKSTPLQGNKIAT